MLGTATGVLVAQKSKYGDCPTGFAASTIAMVMSPGIWSSSIHTSVVASSSEDAAQNVIVRNHRHCRRLLVVICILNCAIFLLQIVFSHLYHFIVLDIM